MPDSKPNIIFLLTDQQRWDALGCVDPVLQTPNLDRLAASGVRYEQAVCNAPMCVPSRCSMMQGLYASQCGVRSNGQSIRGAHDLMNTPFPEVLRQQGYRTMGFGKTHWYGGWFDNQPDPHGFEKIWQPRPSDSNLYPDDALCWDVDEPEAFAAWVEEQKTLPRGGENLHGLTTL